MKAERFACCDERRRTLILAAAAQLSGIDYIEVKAGKTTADKTTIDIVLVKALGMAAAALTVDNIGLTGGARYRAPKVAKIDANLDGAGDVKSYTLTIDGNQPTDFSIYRLAIVTSAINDEPPPFIDDRLAAVDFSFKAACASDFDCAPDCNHTAQPPLDPPFDYRVRDYQGFRRLMLDRLAQLVPDFRESDPVDFTTMLVEAGAFRADQQTYRLDWVGTEAFLDTARSRASITRHARLVDYTVNEGASARVFARFETGVDDVMIANHTPLLVRMEGVPDVVPVSEYRRTLARGPLVFETVDTIWIQPWRNHIAFYTWGDDECRLAKGATSATLVADVAAKTPLAAGDFLLLVETASPDNGEAADARLDHRHIVRMTNVRQVKDKLQLTTTLVAVEWSEADALPFDLVIQTHAGNAMSAAAATICAEACANVVLADHGTSLPPAVDAMVPGDIEALRPHLMPPSPEADEPWRPTLDRGDLARIEPVDFGPGVPASALAQVDPSQCLPALVLDDDFNAWTARRDLLASDHFDRGFVVETAIDLRVALRFGDSVEGLAPAADSQFAVSGRFGVGRLGNIGAGALAHVVLGPPYDTAPVAVSNPLPARGGSDPESIAAIRVAAPQAFRVQERAVSAADYAEAVMQYEGVASAVAVPRWTGAWQTMLVYVDRKGGLAMDASFRRSLLEHIERYRLMGFDVALHDAIPAPLDLALLVCARPGELRAVVAARVRDALRPSGGADGVHGFFHPDHFTFGAPLYLSRLVQAVMQVEGVQSVNVRKFQRLRGLPGTELSEGVIRPHPFEVLQLDDDPSFPERGRLVLDMGGGR
ncbi:baseplate J/gp47 family protein [Paraburkholderia caribensis]|uniref:baseplate J/gp47 family protein n=1 Tax=Paraburkholderia caribensis TaxID=75105 RepID=UPI001D08947C|nr:baseplate J/gp47 family protein [Paraburkholderia caribensis]